MESITALYVKAQVWLQSLRKDEKGATMVEYALMLALIAVFCVAAVTQVGTSANGKFSTIATKIGG